MLFSFKGETALHDAAAFGNVKVANILIRHKADVNATGYSVSSFCIRIQIQKRQSLVCQYSKAETPDQYEVSLVVHGFVLGTL